MRSSTFRWALLVALGPMALGSAGCEDDELSKADGSSPRDATLARDAQTLDSGTFPDAHVGQDAAPGMDADLPDPDGGDADGGDADGGDADGGDADGGVLSDSGLDAGGPACLPPEPPLLAGAVDCSGCPTSDPLPGSFSLALGQVTTVSLSGSVTDATGDGMYAVIGAGGRRIDGPVPIGPSGGWSVTVPLFCGAQQVALTFCNEAGAHSLVFDVSTDCTEPDLRVTINWDELGDDWELHLIQEGGQINDSLTDCTWTTCIGGGLDWGVAGDSLDDPVKDVDDVDGYGPENITLTRPASGTYTVMVEHWGPGSPDSDGEAILNIAGQAPIVIPIIDLRPRWVRTVATITFPGGATATSSVVYDCTQNWSGGCRDPIP